MQLDHDRRPRPWWIKLVFCAAVIVCTLVSLELVIRFFFPQDLDFFNFSRVARPSAKPGFGAELIPHSHTGSFVGVPVDVNDAGLRDYDIPRPKPKGTYRIVVVGDSVTFGYGVRLEDSYPKVLQRQLNDRKAAGADCRYEVVNAGLPATGPPYYYHFVRGDAAALEPDMILIGVVLNDVAQYDPNARDARPRTTQQPNSLRDLNYWLLFHSHLYSLVYRDLKGLLYALQILDMNKLHGYDFFALQEPSRELEAAWDSTLSLLSDTIELARSHGWQIGLVVFPVEVQLSAEALAHYRRMAHLDLSDESLLGRPQQRLAEFGRAHGVLLVDLLPVYKEHDRNGLFLRNKSVRDDPVHPSVFGHQLAGETISDALFSSGVLPPKCGAAPEEGRHSNHR